VTIYDKDGKSLRIVNGKWINCKSCDRLNLEKISGGLIKKLLRNQVIKNSGKEQTNRVKRVKNLKLTNGNFYTGEMKNGDPNGQGTETFPNGNKYVGEFKDGSPNGQGTETFPNGQKYVGEFKDGKENGYGTYTWFDGEKYVGEHKDGRFWNGIYYDKNGNITTKFVNGQEWAGY